MRIQLLKSLSKRSWEVLGVKKASGLISWTALKAVNLQASLGSYLIRGRKVILHMELQRAQFKTPWGSKGSINSVSGWCADRWLKLNQSKLRLPSIVWRSWWKGTCMNKDNSPHWRQSQLGLCNKVRLRKKRWKSYLPLKLSLSSSRLRPIQVKSLLRLIDLRGQSPKNPFKIPLRAKSIMEIMQVKSINY
jgi:hypothetical protein